METRKVGITEICYYMYPTTPILSRDRWSGQAASSEIGFSGISGLNLKIKLLDMMRKIYRNLIKRFYLRSVRPAVIIYTQNRNPTRFLGQREDRVKSSTCSLQGESTVRRLFRMRVKTEVLCRSPLHSARKRTHTAWWKTCRHGKL